MDLISERGQADLGNELWIKEQYDLLMTSGAADYCLVTIELKNFQKFIHLIGHDKQEDAIRTCFNELASCLGENEYISRIHSFYFNLLLVCPAHEDALHHRAASLHHAVRDTMETQYGRKLYLDMGFYPMIQSGIDFYNAQYFADLCRLHSPHRLYEETNYDMYYIFFNDQNEEFRKVENRLQTALERGDFKLYLQPKVDTVTGKVNSAEALMRWIDPEYGMIPLSSFYPNLEENGFIRDVDLYLFNVACQYLNKWINTFHKDITISFNLSSAYFNGPYFMPEYTEVFSKYNFPPSSVRIELLESIVHNETSKLKSMVESIYTFGFSCALDDFGSGFSSFDVLTNVRLTELKIDRSLFQDVNNPNERTLIRHIVDVAHDMDMVTVAEGIETEEYASYLKEIGCDYIQGFYYYRPMPVEEFEKRFVLKDSDGTGSNK